MKIDFIHNPEWTSLPRHSKDFLDALLNRAHPMSALFVFPLEANSRNSTSMEEFQDTLQSLLSFNSHEVRHLAMTCLYRYFNESEPLTSLSRNAVLVATPLSERASELILESASKIFSIGLFVFFLLQLFSGFFTD